MKKKRVEGEVTSCSVVSKSCVKEAASERTLGEDPSIL